MLTHALLVFRDYAHVRAICMHFTLVCRRMLTYAFLRMLTYADVC